MKNLNNYISETEGVGAMKNQPAYDKNGNYIGWLSRSIAVLNIVLGYKDVSSEEHRYFYGPAYKLFVLAGVRGQGTPDPEFVGAWNCTTGYLDYNETLVEAAKRETFEETGVDLTNEKTQFWCYNDDPKKDKRQNVTIRFYTLIKNPIDNIKFSHDNNEKDEVGDIKWIPYDEISKYRWAFNHDKLINQLVSEMNIERYKYGYKL